MSLEALEAFLATGGGWDWRGRALGETARWARLSASCWAFCFGEQGKPVSGDYAFVPITIK